MTIPEDPAPFHIELDLREPVVRPRKAAPSAPTIYDGDEAQEVMAEARRFGRDPEQVMRLYQEDPETWGGAYISGDELLRMLPCRPRHPWLSYALGSQVLLTLPRELFTRRLALPARPGERVLFTMGMPASGKTTLVKAGFGKRFFAVVDSPLASFDMARELMREVQATGRGISFVLASRPLAVAAAGMLDRAMPGHEERAVPLAGMAENILKAMDVFRKLAGMNRYDGDTTLDVVRHDGERREWVGGDAAVALLASLLPPFLMLPGGILGQLVAGWKQALEAHRAKGEFIPDVLRAVAEDGMDIHAFASESGPSVVETLLPAQGGLSKEVRSLAQLPGWREWIPGHLNAADAHEACLKEGLGPTLYT